MRSPRQRGARALVVPLVLSFLAGPSAPAAAAADLPPQAAKAFDAYVALVEARRARELASSHGFLAADFGDQAETRAIRRAVASGEIPVTRLSERGGGTDAINVPGGLINHWRGAILVPGVSLDQVLAELRQPPAGPEMQEDVLEARVLERDGDRSRLFLKLVRRQVVTVVYNTEHDVRFVRINRTRAWSRSVSLRIAEVVNAGTPAEYEKPVGHDRGFLWRLNACWRYEQVPGGVIVELESITLSRDIPPLIRFIAQPLIDSIARESVTRTLESVRARVLRSAAAAGTRATG